MISKRILTLFFCLSTLTVFSQDKGIKFERSLTWQQIKEKAKRENKYIFIDGFTTWCGPCKKMAAEVFPQEKVGSFFNANFINVAVQFDKTAKDNTYVKTWYKDAEKLEKEYNIKSYPSYIFLNPDGKLVFRYGSYAEADTFISKAATALKMDYEKLKSDYLAGKSAPATIRQLIHAGMQAYDITFLQIIVNDYLKDQNNLLTTENLQYINIATSKTTHPGFKVLLNNGDKLDSITTPGRSFDLLQNIIFDEQILPALRTGGKKSTVGPMVIYEGSVKSTVDWQTIKNSLDQSYPLLADDLLLFAKTMYFDWTGKWDEYSKALKDFTAKKALSNQRVNHFAWTIFSRSNDPEALNTATELSRQTISDTSTARIGYMYTYAHLLYKTGNSTEALKVIESAATQSQNPADFQDLIRNMKEGKKLW